MKLYDRLQSDNLRILTVEQGEITLYRPDGQSETGPGRWSDIGLSVDANGQMMVGKSYRVDFSLENFSDLIQNDDESFKNWMAEFVNSRGQNIIGYFSSPMVDSTLGYVSTTINKARVVS